MPRYSARPREGGDPGSLHAALDSRFRGNERCRRYIATIGNPSGPNGARSFPGRGAARSAAPLIRDLPKLGVRNGPGSAAHHSAQERSMLRRARDTRARTGPPHNQNVIDPNKSRRILPKVSPASFTTVPVAGCGTLDLNQKLATDLCTAGRAVPRFGADPGATRVGVSCVSV